MIDVAAAILGFFVTVIGTAIVAGALVLAAILMGLHVVWYAQAAWRWVQRAMNPTHGWWPGDK